MQDRNEKRREEIGATAGKTHEEVLDRVIGRERRVRNEAKTGPPDKDETGTG